jgi:pimeloyl-ACP methyl ester carboxylesterase
MSQGLRFTQRNARRFALLAALALGACAPEEPDQPPQPASGPGGSDYKHAELASEFYGSGDTAYFIVEPRQPTPASAPVVYFMHGYGALSPGLYSGWVGHLVLHGAIVIYPQYQADLLTDPKTYTGNTVAAIKQAYAELAKPGHVAPELDHVAAVGHSMGGAIAANLAALAASEAIPQPTAVLSANAGNRIDSLLINMPLADFAQIPQGVLLLVVTGNDDAVGNAASRAIFNGATAVPAQDKDYVTLFSDGHGNPALLADHAAPEAAIDGTAGLPDALDYNGYWKLFDALMSAAFSGTQREYALGGTPQQRSLGNWDDGTPVTPMAVTDTP